MKFITKAVAAVALAASAVLPTYAQKYPSKPIIIVVGFAAGGPTDIVARSLAASMEKTLGQPILVENKAGAGAVIGIADIARSSPDGYRLLVHHIGMATAPALYRKLSFDPLRDFEYIGLINEVPMTLLVSPQMAPNNMKELIPYLKANSNKVSFANAGLGSASHLCGLLFMSAIETDLTTVPYKGTAPAMTDLIGGQVDMLCDQTTSTTAQINGGKIKAMAITSPKRLATLKAVPTAAEGGLPNFNLGVWHGLYAPRGTPKPIIDALVKALQAAVTDPVLIKKFEELGAITVSKDKATPDALAILLRSEINKWGPIIKKAGVYAD